MAGAVLGVGTGVFLIALIWIVTLVLSLLLSRASAPTKLLIIPIVLLALTITLILVLFPRAPEVPSPVKETQIVTKQLYRKSGPKPLLTSGKEKLPLSKKKKPPEETRLKKGIRPPQIVDTFFIGRYVLLSIVSVVFLAALFTLLPFHLLEPVYAKPVRAH